MFRARRTQRTAPATRTAATAIAGALALALLAGGCTSAEEGGPAPTPDPSVTDDRELATADLWLAFEESEVSLTGATEFPDAVGGDVEGVVVTGNGGGVEVVDGAEGGSAVQFPAPCADATGCPRAMVEVASDPALEPGERAFEFGATVWLAPDATSSGSNIVQKGRFATDGGLWKLQVDTVEGQPSCVLRSGETLLRVRATQTIADSTWHEVSCVRDARGIGIVVDGAEQRRAGSTGSVDSEWPIRIGSPGVGDGDDQFHGRIDDVFLRILPEG